MRTGLIAFMLVSVAAFAAPDAMAQQPTETDRLRDALRSATSQVRSLEDQSTVMQAKNSELEREKAALKTEVDAVKAQIKQVDRDYRQAVREFNERLEERNQTLEKWKEAYAEAASVARTKDAERAKFESEANTYKASTKACTLKNQELVKVGRELLGRYEGVTFSDMIWAREPVTGIRRVQIQNLLQDYGDKVLSQKIQP